MATKFCKKCGQTKSLESFSKSRKEKDGLAHSCKVCASENGKRWYKKNKKKVNRRMQEYHRNNIDKDRDRMLRNTYGIDTNDYNAMFVNQNGCCAICGVPQTCLKKRLHVDHCHRTGRVRGLLCYICNTRLGTLEDEDFTSKVQEYLK